MTKWRNRRLGLAVLLTMVASTVVPAAEVAPEIQDMFTRAAGLANEKKYTEALSLLQELAQKVPDAPGVFGNLALVARELGNRELEVQSRLRYLELRPGDLRQMLGLLRAYQAWGKLAERDAQREKVIALWSALPPAEKEVTKGYNRDEFDAGGVHFIVTEYFEPAAPIRRIYRFDAVDAAGKGLYFFGFESGDSDTSFSRQQGFIKQDERMYSLDRYETRDQMALHATFGLLKQRPTYDQVRSMVVDAVEGRLRATTSSTRPIPQQPTPQEQPTPQQQ